MVLLYYRASCSILIGKNTQKLENKNTKQVCWNTPGDDYNNNYAKKVEIVLPELYAAKIVMRDFCMDDSQSCHRVDMILVHEFPSS